MPSLRRPPQAAGARVAGEHPASLLRYTRSMKTICTVVVLSLLVAPVPAQEAPQEKPVPKDSARISIPGCAKGQMFTVKESPEHESRSSVRPGMRFRMAGKKDVLKEIKARESSMIEITGLVRKGQIEPGVSVAGGRVRISPGPAPGSNVGNNPNYDQIVIDVEGWRPLSGECPK